MTSTLVAAAWPTRTLAPLRNPVPVSLIDVLPCGGPPFGVTEDTVGGVR
jgi:hypothetical protein